MARYLHIFNIGTHLRKIRYLHNNKLDWDTDILNLNYMFKTGKARIIYREIQGYGGK